MELLITVTAIGTGATVAMDLWGLARRRLLGMPAPDYAMLGRWIGHMPRGRFSHPSISKAEAIPGERLLGWLAHYATGLLFAAALVMIAGSHWLRAPSPGIALAVGLGSVAAPFLVMQPAIGAGWFASRTPAPGRARLQSLATHLVFGVGLYVAALLVQLSRSG
jgi:hypothetical protein